VVVNLDPHATHEGQLVLPNGDLGLPYDEPFGVVDELSNARYTWRGTQHYLRLSPDAPAHIFRVERGAANETTHPVYHRPVHA
jgi:starch synthase (maltosyl-transferring)